MERRGEQISPEMLVLIGDFFVATEPMLKNSARARAEGMRAMVKKLALGYPEPVGFEEMMGVGLPVNINKLLDWAEDANEVLESKKIGFRVGCEFNDGGLVLER